MLAASWAFDPVPGYALDLCRRDLRSVLLAGSVERGQGPLKIDFPMWHGPLILFQAHAQGERKWKTYFVRIPDVCLVKRDFTTIVSPAPVRTIRTDDSLADLS